MANYWLTTVNELLSIFRGALIALIPWIEKAQIKWKDGEYYDDWDNITESIFNNIVCSSLISEVASKYNIARYSFLCLDLSTIDFIQVISKCHPDKHFAFVSYQSNAFPFDSVKVAELDKSYKVIGYLNLNLEDLDFAYVKKNIDGKRDILTDIEVFL